MSGRRTAFKAMTNNTPEKEQKKNLRTEYLATHEAYIHYDNFAWKVGSVLIAGVFIYWGFVISSSPDPLHVILGNLLVCFLMSIWMIYAEHNRQIYLFKLHRIRELEDKLGMCQHRRFRDSYDDIDNIKYDPKGPKGHHLNNCIYFFASLGGLLPCLVKKTGYDWQLCMLHYILISFNFLIVGWVILYVHGLGKTTEDLIEKFEEEASKSKGNSRKG